MGLEVSIVADTIPVVMAYTTTLCADTVSADVENLIGILEKINHEYVISILSMWLYMRITRPSYLGSGSVVIDQKMCLTPRYL